jgi:hypothetical protein
LKLALPATAAQCPDGRRQLGWEAGGMVEGEDKPGLTDREVESLWEAAVGQSGLWVSQATPNKRLQPNCYRRIFEPLLAGKGSGKWVTSCPSAIG